MGEIIRSPLLKSIQLRTPTSYCSSGKFRTKIKNQNSKIALIVKLGDCLILSQLNKKNTQTDEIIQKIVWELIVSEVKKVGVYVNFSQYSVYRTEKCLTCTLLGIAFNNFPANAIACALCESLVAESLQSLHASVQAKRLVNFPPATLTTSFSAHKGHLNYVYLKTVDNISTSYQPNANGTSKPIGLPLLLLLLLPLR